MKPFSRAFRASVAPPGASPSRNCAADLLAEAAALEVRARRLAARRFPEVALVERGRLLEQREQPLALPALAILLRRALLVLQRHVEPVGQELDRTDEVQVLLLLDERDRVAALAAAEALERASVGRHAEARRLLVVERAQPDEARAGLPQSRVALDERDDVGGRLDGFDGLVLDPRHQRLSA